MVRRSKSHLKLFAVAALGFLLACALLVFERQLAAGVLETVCETAAYLLLTGAVLSLSYAVFVRSWNRDGSS